MAANENRKVTTVNVEDQLTVIAVILINRALSLTKETKELAKILNGDVGDLIRLLFGQLGTGLEALADRRELISGISREGLVGGSLLHSQNLIIHANLQYQIRNR